MEELNKDKERTFAIPFFKQRTNNILLGSILATFLF